MALASTLKHQPWLVAEICLAPFIFAYFLLYPRDTISDFIVCSSLCFIILAFGHKNGLTKPLPQAYKLPDFILLATSLALFLGAWVYAFNEGKINTERATESIMVSVLYFYYAWIQHFLAQRYTAMRMLGFVEKNMASSNPVFESWSKESKAALLTGLIFGVLHIPYPNLMLPAAFGGFIYAWYFLITGRLWAVVSSHALISSAWIYWALDSNAFEEFTFIF